jgi:hypothetical protein
VNFRQCIHGKAKPLLREGSKGKQITRKQEIEYLSATVRQNEEPASPTLVKQEYVLGNLVVTYNSFTRVSRPMALASHERSIEECTGKIAAFMETHFAM